MERKILPGEDLGAEDAAILCGAVASTEVNYTFKSLPSAKSVDNWLASTPERFRVSLKAPQQITHFSRLKGGGESLAAFHAAVAGIGKKLGPVLFQLPPNFKADAGRLRDFLKSMPDGLRAAFEFRHESWF